MQFVGPIYSRRIPGAEGVPAVVGGAVLSPIPERRERRVVSSSPITAPPRIYAPHELRLRMADEERVAREAVAEEGTSAAAIIASGGKAWDPYAEQKRGDAGRGHRTITSERKTPLTLTEVLDAAIGTERETVTGIVVRR
jgi:hypothetical protein